MNYEQRKQNPILSFAPEIDMYYLQQYNLCKCNFFFNSVHILQLDITNKKDIENVVSFINNRVGSEGKLQKCFFKNDFTSFNGTVYLLICYLRWVRYLKMQFSIQQNTPLLLVIHVVVNAWFIEGHEIAQMQCCFTVLVFN